MKILGLLAISLLLGSTGMAQEAKSKVGSSQKAETNMQSGKSKKTTTVNGGASVVAEQGYSINNGATRSLDAAEAKGETRISQLTKTVAGAETGNMVSELASTAAQNTKTERPNNHGAAVSSIATSDIAADVKGQTISGVAASVGMAHAAVKSVDVATQTAVKANPNVRANVNAKTKVDVKPVSVSTNTKIRTAVGIK